jgi:hypothetical protein
MPEPEPPQQMDAYNYTQRGGAKILSKTGEKKTTSKCCDDRCNAKRIEVKAPSGSTQVTYLGVHTCQPPSAVKPAKILREQARDALKSGQKPGVVHQQLHQAFAGMVIEHFFYPLHLFTDI